MRRYLIALSLIPILILSPTAALAEDFSSLEERMSYNEFKAAGLDKLSPEELKQLNLWLQQRASAALAAPQAGGYATAAPPAADMRGLPAQRGSYEPIVSRIPGEFRGWSGKTRFTLENGQVWESAAETAALAVRLTDPTVTIEQGMFDGWFMQVDGYNAKARVKRIK
jgi:hypothetical protein